MLIDEREHTFQKDGIAYAYAPIEELQAFAGIPVYQIDQHACDQVDFRLLSLEQYRKVYTASAKDGYRVEIRQKKDRDKLAVIETYLNRKELLGMIVLITGASHTGKTLLAQRILEKYKYPYLSIDHLKMGLIRSGNTNLTPMSSQGELTDYLWPICREIIKTAIENSQNLTIEGCYIPFDWQKDFSPDEREQIRYICLVMGEDYIKSHFSQISSYANVIERRQDDGDFSMEYALVENRKYAKFSEMYGLDCIHIENEYPVAGIQL